MLRIVTQLHKIIFKVTNDNLFYLAVFFLIYVIIVCF